MAGTERPMPPRGTEPDDVLRQAAERRRGIATQADILADARRMLAISATGENPEGFEGNPDIIGDQTIRGRVYFEFDNDNDLVRFGPTVGPDDPLATLEGGAFKIYRVSAALTHIYGESADGFSYSRLTNDGSLTTRNGAVTLRDVSDAVTIQLAGNGGTITASTVEADDGLHSHDLDARWEASFHANYGAATYTTVGMAAVTTSGTLTGTSSSSAGPFVSHTTTAGSGNIAQAVSAVGWQTRWGFDSVFRVRAEADIANVRFWVGHAESDPSGSTTPNINLAAFRFDDSVDTGWICRSCAAGGVTQSTSSGVTVAINTTYLLRIKTRNGTDVEFYVDGVLVATHATTVPTTSVNLSAYVSVTNRTAGETNSIGVRHVKVLSR